MKNHSQTQKNFIHIIVITVIAAVLSNTIVYRFTSMLAFKSDVEIKDSKLSDLYTKTADKSLVRKVSRYVTLIAADTLNRSEIADVLNRIQYYSPRAIGIDYRFLEPRSGDSILVKATSASNVVMAAKIEKDSSLSKSYFCEGGHEAKIGITNIDGGVVRQYRSLYEIDGRQYYSFAAEVVRTGGFLTASNAEYGTIYYPAIIFRKLNPQDVFDTTIELHEYLQDKIVLVGSINSDKDMHLTPLGKKMSGIEIMAHIVETIVEKKVRQSSTFVNWTIAVVSCVIVLLLNMYLTKREFKTGKLIFRFAQITLLYLYFQVGCMLFTNKMLCVDFSPSLSMIAVGLLAYDIYFGILTLLEQIINKIKRK